MVKRGTARRQAVSRKEVIAPEFIRQAKDDAVTSADNLVYMCENKLPSNYVDNGEQKGISIEMLKLMWKELRVPRQPIKVVPWARGYDIVQTEKNHGLFSMTRTKERESLFKWAGPVFTVQSVLMGGAGSKKKYRNS